jgi:hypothetical protein
MGRLGDMASAMLKTLQRYAFARLTGLPASKETGDFVIAPLRGKTSRQRQLRFA